jgi:hypothetical protein
MVGRLSLGFAIGAIVAFAGVPVAEADPPAFLYETTVPGYYLASGHGVAVDSASNAYVLGSWYQDTQHLDILVVKVGADGGLVWTVTIIGQSHDFATDIALDSAGDVWITGFTDSEDFPTVNALDDSLTGFRDAFVTKLSAVDGTILYSTFLGGDYVDDGRGIALNAEDEIYLVGSTQSMDFPTVDPIQAELNGYAYAYSDAFVTKLSADGSTILYSTYLGGTDDDMADGVALDGSDNICFVGRTGSSDFPTANPMQATYAGEIDAFVARISADGSALDYSTYLGGEEGESPGGIFVDSAGCAYVGGSTASIGFPTTPGAFQETFVGAVLGCFTYFPPTYFNCDDMFLSKLLPDGSAFEYSTFVGGTDMDRCRDIAVDSAGNAYLVGYTTSEDFPLTVGQPNYGIVVAKMSADGSSVAYALAVQSGSSNAGHGVAIDATGDAYVAAALNVPSDVYVARITERGISLSGYLSNDELVLQWTPWPPAAAYWVYGAPDTTYFATGLAPGYEHRLAAVTPPTTGWSSPSGVGVPGTNWTYLVLAVDASETELRRSNRFGEHDFSAATTQ